MTLSRFQNLLRKIDPRLRIRSKGRGDIGGLFATRVGPCGSYIARVTKGDLAMKGYRIEVVDPQDPFRRKNSRIQKRGRVTLIQLLRKYRWIKNHKQRSMLYFGIEPKVNIGTKSRRILLNG